MMDNHCSLLCQKQVAENPPPPRQNGSVQVEGRQSSIPKTKHRGLNTQESARGEESEQGNRSGGKRTNNKCEVKQNTQRKDGKNNRKCKLTAVIAHANWNHDVPRSTWAWQYSHDFQGQCNLRAKLCAVGTGTAGQVESRVDWLNWEHERKSLCAVGGGGGLLAEFEACGVPWRLEGLQESKFKHLWVYDVFLWVNYF